jgi:LacI family transcriptional regulator
MAKAILKPPTSAQVARQAGVSRTTVSFVLNGVKDQGISDVTRAKVLQVAREMGYQPNAAARSLASGNTRTVALVIPKASHLYVDAFLAQLVATLNEECHQYGLKLLIESTDDEGKEPDSFVNLVRGRNIDGLIVANQRISEHQHLQKIQEAQIPLVFFSSKPNQPEDWQTVGSDTCLSALMAVQHLIELGHQKIAFVSFAQPEYDSVNEREVGWRQALLKAGIAINPACVEYADISAQSGYEATRRLLARQTQFTALFAGNDTIAFGAIRALTEAGLKVPQDVAIVGFDDIPMAAFASPPLTTMRSDPVGLGKAALQKLMAQMNLKNKISTETIDYHFEPRLIIRESCGYKFKSFN